MVVILAHLLTSSTKQGYYVEVDKGKIRMKRIPVAIIAGLFLVTLILPQLALAAGPAISSVSATDITDTSAEISWTTTTNSTISANLVNYGTSEALGQTQPGSSNVTSPSIVLTGLTPGTIYYYEVQSTDASGTSADGPYSFQTLAPAGYSITLEPVCGVCGDLVEVGVCGEVIGVTALVAAAGTYHICWDSPTAGNVKGTFTASGAGIHTLTFFLPESTKGNHTVHLADNTYASKASAIFIVNPSVKIDPEEGPMGTVVTLNGYGFTALQDIQVKFKDTVITTTKANDKGSWTVSYTIPSTPAGGYTFDIEAKEGTVWVGWVSKYFKVTPKITVTPDSGTVKQTIAVSGTGFASKEADIEVTFDGEVRKENIYAVEDGSWSTTIAVPPVQSGRYIIDAWGIATRARNVPDVTFTVVAGILVEPSPAYVGDTITVTGGGFRPEETGIKVTFEGMTVATGITANIDGCWESSFTLPSSTYGSHTVSASGDTTGAVTTTLNTQARILELSPVEGAPGDSVSLTGNGFSGDKKLTVTIGGIVAPGDMRTQFNGNVVISFRVPKGSTEGTRTLVVTDEGGATASVDFTVTKKILSTTPLPISPQDSKLRSGEVTFRWQGITGGTGYAYTLEISKTAGSGNIWSKSGIRESSYLLTNNETLPKGTYYWRVKIVDDYGNEGPWSDSIKFMVSPIPTWVWVVVGLVVLVVLMVVAYRETKFKVTE
jgi:hypothetical protein